MQFFSGLLPNHLPKRMENFRKKYEHYWIIEMSDNGIDEARIYFQQLFSTIDGNFFECNTKEAKKALLHRFVSASAIGR